MNEEELKELYANSAIATAFLDHMAARRRNQSETKVDRVLTVLSNEGFEFTRGDIVDLLQKLEEFGCGQFVIGRRGWPSRFVWSVGSLAASRLAGGEIQVVENVTSEEDTVEKIEEIDELITHLFNLRPDLAVNVRLPADLTQKEAERLSLFMHSLPMEDYE